MTRSASLILLLLILNEIRGAITVVLVLVGAFTAHISPLPSIPPGSLK